MPSCRYSVSRSLITDSVENRLRTSPRAASRSRDRRASSREHGNHCSPRVPPVPGCYQQAIDAILDNVRNPLPRRWPPQAPARHGFQHADRQRLASKRATRKTSRLPQQIVFLLPSTQPGNLSDCSMRRDRASSRWSRGRRRRERPAGKHKHGLGTERRNDRDRPD